MQHHKCIEKTVAISKILALVISALMVLSMTAALASDYKITVSNSNSRITMDGKQYEAVKLFDLTLGNPTTTDGTTTYGAYSYSIDSDGEGAWAWNTIKGTAGANGVYTNSTYDLTFTPSANDSTVYAVTAGSGFTAAKANDLGEALRSVSRTGAWTKTGTASGNSLTIDVEKAGYYLVYGVVDAVNGKDTDKEVVSAVILDSTNKSVTVAPKADAPTLDKKITGEHKLDQAGLEATAKVGEQVEFTITCVRPDFTGYTDYYYAINDTMTNGLDFTSNDTLNLTINNVAQSATGTPASGDNAAVPADYSITWSNSNRTFVLVIPQTTLAKYDVGAEIKVVYTATLNSSALTTDFERNTAYLEYSSNPSNSSDKNKTPDKDVYVVDINIDVDKIANGDTTKHLAGAKFKLYREVTADNTTTTQYYKWDATNNVVTWTNEANAQVFTTNAQGNLDTKIQGLDKGTYKLIETEPPQGYNSLSAPVEIVITAADGTGDDAGKKVTYTATVGGSDATVTNGTVTLGKEQHQLQPEVTAQINNNSGTELPSTGGIGTTLFYIGGGVLVLLAVVMLVTKKRMKAED